jgi:hypothetical protein
MPCRTAIRVTWEYRRALAIRLRTDRSRPSGPSPPPLGNAISARNGNIIVARNAHPAIGISSPTNRLGSAWAFSNSDTMI